MGLEGRRPHPQFHYQLVSMGFRLWHQNWDPENPQQLLSHEQSDAGTHSDLLTSVLSGGVWSRSFVWSL